MKLTFESLKNKNINIVSEKETQRFMNNALDNAIKVTSDVLGRKPELKDLEDFTLSGIWDFLRDIKGFKNALFIGEGGAENILWNVIIDKDIVLLDAYHIDRENEKLTNYLNYELKIMGERTGESSITLSEELKKITEDVELLMLTIPMRLAFYIILFTKTNIK